MKLLFVFSTLVIGHTLAYYVPTKVHPVQIPSCGCGGAIHELNLEPSEEDTAQEEQGPNTDVRYKFNFDVEQPREVNPDKAMRSYSYDIQEPVSEPQPDNTKYKFDFAIQSPSNDDPSAHPEPRLLDAHVDRTYQEKPECTCMRGQPCTCGYSREQSAENAQNPSNGGYVLPVRYSIPGEQLVIYEMPEHQSEQQYMQRNARQAPPQMPQQGSLHEHMQALLNSDRIREFHAALVNPDRLREAHAALMNPDRLREAHVALQQSFAHFAEPREPTVGAAQHYEAFRHRLTKVANPILEHAGKVVEDVRKTLGLARRKRDTDATYKPDQSIPMLRVKEYDENSSDKNHFAKYLKDSSVDVEDSQRKERKEVEKATHCHQCGSELNDTVCKQCGAHQPQYVEYIEGKPVAFFPGAVQAKEERSDEPRYIFDRYGHKYLENNGNLQLITPQYQEATVADQPNFPGLANILSHNQEILHQLNPNPGRMLPLGTDLVKDYLDLFRDLSRRDTSKQVKYMEDASEKEDEKSAEKKEEKPRSMYQVLPMRYEGRDGNLVVKVYSAKHDKNIKRDDIEKVEEDSKIELERNESEEYRKNEWSNKHEESRTAQSEPIVKRFHKDNKEYEILSFNNQPSNSGEDVRRILDYLHRKNSW